MKYSLNRLSEDNQRVSFWTTTRNLLLLVRDERGTLCLSVLATLLNSFINLGSPFVIGYLIDTCIKDKDFHRILVFAGILAVAYVVAMTASYFQTRLMGEIGQRLLFRLRNNIFSKMQSMPIAFFNANKAGDLISRLNNDTEKLNAFFSESLAQFVGCMATIIGAAAFLLVINPMMGLIAIAPATGILLFTKFVSPMLSKRNAKSLESESDMTSEVHESLNNFRVIVAFNRRSYLKSRFTAMNSKNYVHAKQAGMMNNTVLPVYSLFANIAQVALLLSGIYLISRGQLTIGLLISYLINVTNFYNPLKMLAPVWVQFKSAASALDRVNQIMAFNNDLLVLPEAGIAGPPSTAMVELRNVYFDYGNGKEVLQDVSFTLKKGKKYSFIGPTGGGKSTIASLIARLYDPVKGSIWINGKDIRTYTPEERSRKIGFILQDPFIFTGTVRDNILYGNEQYVQHTREELQQALSGAHLQALIRLFDNGLDTRIADGGNNISIGQKQLVSFMRTFLRNPEILILDEASANIDTYTEQLLTEILDSLPPTTTCIVIAHRLNTIENADEIFFVNAGNVSPTESFVHAIDKLKNDKRVS